MTVNISLDADQAFRNYMNQPRKTVEPMISRLYDLCNVPTRGKAYMTRSTVMTRPGDVMRIHPDYRPQAMDLFEHLARTGTSVMHAEDVVWSKEYGAGLSGAHSDLPAEFFMFDHDAHRVRPDEHRLRAILAHEDKVAFAETWADQRGLMPLTAVVRGRSGLDTLGYEVVRPARAWHIVACRPGRLKIGLGASGDGNDTFVDYEGLEQLMFSSAWCDKDFVVQRDVGRFDASVSYYADETGLYFLFATRQANSGACQEGNFLDRTYEVIMRQKTDLMAIAACEAGVRGYFNFDTRVDPDQGEAWVIECNARPTAPTYGWVLAQRHRAPWFCVMNLKNVPGTSIDEVLPHSLEFTAQQGVGGVIHNPGPLCLSEKRSCTVTVLAPDATIGMDVLQDIQRTSGALMEQATAA